MQRSQTLFLLAAFFLSLLLLTGPIARFSTDAGERVVETELKYNGLYILDANGDAKRQDLATWPITVLFSVLALLSFLNIFFYRNRMRQMRVCVFLMLLYAGAEGLMFYYAWVAGSGEAEHTTQYLWRFVLPPVAIILSYLALRRIRRDELLVKAYDRIR